MLTSPSSTVSLFMTWGRRRRIHKCVVWLVSKFADGIVMKNVDLMWYGLVLLCNDWIWNSWLRADFWKWTPGNNWGWRRVALWKVFRSWGGWERERPWEMGWICLRKGMRVSANWPHPFWTVPSSLPQPEEWIPPNYVSKDSKCQLLAVVWTQR